MKKAGKIPGLKGRWLANVFTLSIPKTTTE
jgi:hypothetical protein